MKAKTVLSMQQKKIDFLTSQGAEVQKSVVVKKPDGIRALVDEFGKVEWINAGADKSGTKNTDPIFIFSVYDYTTELVGRKSEDGFFYVQRGDGDISRYHEYRVEWSKPLIVGGES